MLQKSLEAPLAAQGLCVARHCAKAEQKRPFLPPCTGQHRNSREAKPGSEQSVPSGARTAACLQTPRCSPWPGVIHLPAGSGEEASRSWHGIAARGCSVTCRGHLGNETPGLGPSASPPMGLSILMSRSFPGVLQPGVEYAVVFVQVSRVLNGRMRGLTPLCRVKRWRASFIDGEALGLPLPEAESRLRWAVTGVAGVAAGADINQGAHEEGTLKQTRFSTFVTLVFRVVFVWGHKLPQLPGAGQAGAASEVMRRLTPPKG